MWQYVLVLGTKKYINCQQSHNSLGENKHYRFDWSSLKQSKVYLKLNGNSLSPVQIFSDNTADSFCK